MSKFDFGLIEPANGAFVITPTSEAATEANDYITVDLGQAYPVQFAF
jgi:hypothetical protein